MVTKKLIHDIITFHNTFIGKEGIITNVTVFNANCFFINVYIKLWSLDEFGLKDVLVGVSDNISDYKDFEVYKENVRNKIVPLLNK